MTFTTVVIRTLKKEFGDRHVFSERKSQTLGDWYEQFCSEVAWNEQYGWPLVRAWLLEGFALVCEKEVASCSVFKLRKLCKLHDNLMPLYM